MTDNNAFIKMLEAGDINAFDELYDRYNLMLYRSAYLMTGNQYDAEDIIQETFLTAFQHIKELRDKTKLKSWLFRIMINLTHRQQAKKKREISDENIVEFIDSKDFRGSDYEDEPENMMLKMDFQNYLMQINVKRREALILYYYNEMSVREIAKICNCFEGTVKSRLHKGRLELRQKINAAESEYNCKERKALNNA
ncbi:MAG: RNA polymerase sigma factor [Anaerovoracaceae bacterium]